MWALGDVLMATPMLNAIRAKEPDAHITWVVDTFHAAVLENHPQIDELIALDSGQWRRLLRKVNLPGWIKRTRELNAQMRSRNFDAVINCQPEKWWTYFLCAAPVTVALFPSPTVPSSGRWYTHAIPKPKRVGLHNTDHFLQATSAIGVPPASKRLSIGQTSDEEPFFRDFADHHGLADNRPVVVLAPFSTADNRSLPPDFAARIADWLTVDLGAHVILTGGPGDADRARSVAESAKKSKVIVAIGTKLREYVSLLRHADLVVTGDSSPMHLAAALDVPYVTLFGPTPVDERAPLDGRGRVLVRPIPCAPCDLPTCSNRLFQECMTRIELADVQRAVRELIAEYGINNRAGNDTGPSALELSAVQPPLTE